MVDMIIMLVTNHTVDLCLAGSRILNEVALQLTKTSCTDIKIWMMQGLHWPVFTKLA
jgi:hypothetical protein